MRPLGPYELSDRTAARLGSIRSSLLTSRVLFVIYAVWFSRDRLPSLLTIATKLPRRLPRIWEAPDAYTRMMRRHWPEIRAWCAAANVRDEWFVGMVGIVVYIAAWFQQGRTVQQLFEGVEPLIEKGTSVRRRLFDEELRLPASNPILEQDADFFARSLEILKEHRTKTIRVALDKGLIVKTPKRQEERDHYYWLAGFQVRQWSAFRISEAEHHVRTSVETAIRNLASEIDLTRRSTDDFDASADPMRIHATIESLRSEVREHWRPDDLLSQFSGILSSIIPREFERL